MTQRDLVWGLRLTRRPKLPVLLLLSTAGVKCYLSLAPFRPAQCSALGAVKTQRANNYGQATSAVTICLSSKRFVVTVITAACVYIYIYIYVYSPKPTPGHLEALAEVLSSKT